MVRNKLLKAVLFDLDGVITDSAHYHYLAWKELADELGIDFDEEYNEKLKGVSRMASLELILENGDAQDKYTEEEKEQFADKKNENYKKLIEQIVPEEILPGIKEFLIELKDHDIRTIVASASRNATFIINKLKLGGYFDHIVDAGIIEHAKPAPDVFLAGAYVAGAAPSECVGIEDAKAGVKAIQCAGMKAVGVGTESQMKEADMILGSTRELSLARIREQFQM